MRNYIKNIRLSAVIVAPLLLACGSDNTGGSTFVTVPDCGGMTGQVLTTDSTGQLACKPLPAGAVSLPACAPDTEALTADGSVLTCTPRNTVDQTTQMYLTTLTMIEQQIKDYGTQITRVGAGPGAQAIYVGPSKQATSGKIAFGTAVTGVAAAAAQCAGDYGAGAHMCTVYELAYSAALGKNLDANTDVAASWVYMQTWRTPGSTTMYPGTPTTPDPYAGLSDNCGGYTSNAAGGAGTNMWTGTSFRFAQQFNQVHVPKFYADSSCDTVQPIACCK